MQVQKWVWFMLFLRIFANTQLADCTQCKSQCHMLVWACPYTQVSIRTVHSEGDIFSLLICLFSFCLLVCLSVCCSAWLFCLFLFVCWFSYEENYNYKYNYNYNYNCNCNYSYNYNFSLQITIASIRTIPVSRLQLQLQLQLQWQLQ